MDRSGADHLTSWVTFCVCTELVADARLASFFRPSVVARTRYFVERRGL